MDIYHARAKLIKEMSKYHSCQTKSGQYFCNYSAIGHFPTLDDLIDDFEE
jgi:hypothetical protein